MRARLLQRREGGDAGAGVGRSERLRHTLMRQEIAGIGYDHMRGIAAGASGAERARGITEQLLALPAHRAFAAADPRIGHDLVADRDTGGLRSECCHLAGDFVPHRERQMHTTGLERDVLAVARSKYPSQMCTSLWHTPAASTRSRTSSPLGSGSGYSRISSGFPHSMICIARMLSSLVAVGYQPHTSRAVSTTRRSLAFSSSIARALPSTVEEKPHCGLRQSCSSGTYFAACSMRRFRSSFFSSAPFLVVTRPRTTVLPLGTKRSGSKPPERASSYSRKKPASASSPDNASA